MKKGKTQKILDIIIPVHYEEDNIKKLIYLVRKYVKTPNEMLLVYQDEKDPTLEIIRRNSKKYRNIISIKSKYGIGMIQALKTGFEKSTAKIICVMMADLSDDPRDIDLMIRKIDKGFDLVCASRYIKNGKRTGGPVLKGFLSFFACYTLKLLTGIPTHDATNAFKCFRANVLKKITIESASGFEFALELTVKSFSLGYKIAEIPTKWKEREKGNSKFNLLRIFPMYLRWYLYAVKKH